MTDKKLGRGIASLLAMDDDIGDIVNNNNTDVSKWQTSDFGENAVVELDMNDVIPNPSQPRKTFNDNSLKELSESIKHNGLLQPIVVVKRTGRNDETQYMIVAGERRYRATKLAGMPKIKAIIIALEEKDILKNAIIENIQREDLNPVEEANGYRRIIEDFGYTHEQLAKEVGKSRAHITNLLRILNLPSEILASLRNNNITLGHAKVLLSVENPMDYLDEIITNQLSVRQLERMIATGSPYEVKNNNKTQSSNSSNEEFEENAEQDNNPENITFDIIKQMYGPLLKNNQQQTNHNDNTDEIQDIREHITGENNNSNGLTEEEKQSIQENLNSIEEYIQNASGLTVNVKLNSDGSGKVEIIYNDAEELLKIVKKIS